MKLSWKLDQTDKQCKRLHMQRMRTSCSKIAHKSDANNNNNQYGNFNANLNPWK